MTNLHRELNKTRKEVTQLRKRLQMPQNLGTRVYNDSGAQIDGGKVVYISGVDSGRPEISLAANNATATAMPSLGVVPYDIADGDAGYVIRYGYARDFDTSALAIGDTVYLGVAGNLVTVAPAAPNLVVYVGEIIADNATEGVLFVNMKMVNDGTGGGGSGWENITLWHLGGVTEYAFSEAGLIAANGAAVSGDVVYIPAGTITLTAAITIIAGVAWVGQNRENTIITATGGGVRWMIQGGDASVLESMTLDFTSNYVGTTAPIYGQKTIMRNVTSIGRTGANGVVIRAALLLSLYYEDGNAVCAVDNCTFTAHGTHTGASVWAGYFTLDDGGAGYDMNTVVRDCEFNIHHSSTTTSAELRALMVSNTSGSGILTVNNCVAYVETTAAGGAGNTYGINADDCTLNDCDVLMYTTDINGTLYGINGDGCVLDSCHVNIYGDDALDADIYGFYLSSSKAFSCYGYIDYQGANEEGFVIVYHLSTCYLYDCHARADTICEDFVTGYSTLGTSYTYDCTSKVNSTRGEGGATVYGLRTSSGTTYAMGCAHDASSSSGTAIDIYSNAGATINVYAVQYDTTGGTGTIAHMLGDRAGLERANIFTKERMDTPDEITATSGGVAASITTVTTEVTTNGDSDLDNVTLANGTSGQVKHIYCVVEGNAADTWKVTPANMVGGTQITFASAGEGCILRYADNEGWVVVGNNGGTIT